MLTPELLHQMTPQRRAALMDRSMEDVTAVLEDMRAIVLDIARNGDRVTLKHYTKLKPDIAPQDLKISPREVEQAYRELDPQVLDGLKQAVRNIDTFHRAQREREMWTVQVAPGILAGRKTVPLDIAGAYVPGGRADYPSSVLMNILPAKVAGVKRIVACTPPGPNMTVSPATIVAADLAGAEALYKMGGPWAVGSMAYGTETVPKVDKIVGPGNKYVTAAKLAVFGLVDIDSPAGPSEGLILADDTARPDWVAVDFLSQVEHDPDAAAILVTPSERLARETIAHIEAILPSVPRRDIIDAALKANSAVLITRTMDEAIDFVNEYAGEHLQIWTEDVWETLGRIRHAGSIFMGPFAPIPAGDYASGTNHVLPTGRCARMFSGLSVDDFVKKPTFQYLSRQGLQGIKDAVVRLAEYEGLPMHARTVRIRFED